ncbi:MAG: hypothetical protein JSW73_04805 [Candidatus Woesearchaeota archaeon]|nr:MAG: hypothetical protein JSW73_04805 [Candidatus Woesearchaeota archaeon]
MFSLGKKKKEKMPDIGNLPDISQQTGPGGDFPSFPEGLPAPEMPSAQPVPMPDKDIAALAPPATSPSPTKEEVEEISESVFSEKTAEVVKKLDDIKVWQKNVISKLELQEKEIGYLRGGINGFRDDIDVRLTDCQKGIKEIRIELKVMEKIFSEIMPTFVEKIKDLADLTDKLKGFSKPDRLGRK